MLQILRQSLGELVAWPWDGERGQSWGRGRHSHYWGLLRDEQTQSQWPGSSC